MECVELSDLEEGEILEYDSYSPVDSSDDLDIQNRPFELPKEKITEGNLRSKTTTNALNFTNRKLNDFSNKNVKKTFRKSYHTLDLESISSEAEYKSDDNGKYLAYEEKDSSLISAGKPIKGKPSAHFYGDVEDIMSEIGETICRKNHNYKKRKSKELEKYTNKSYNLWHSRIFSSHMKCKKHKRKKSCSDSEPELIKFKDEKRRKRKKKREVYEAKNRARVSDFDERRRNLLEKLKKQKAEEESQVLVEEQENSEIQEVEMQMDSTNYVDEPSCAVENSAIERKDVEEMDGEEELDLVKLRLIALASNKKRTIRENSLKTESSFEEKNADDPNKEKDVDLDRNELLLRAEALKTALLKKHQKRLKKLKIEKKMGIGIFSESESNFPLPSVEDTAKCDNLEQINSNSKENNGNEETQGKNVIQSEDNLSLVSPKEVLNYNVGIEKKEPIFVSNGNLKRVQYKMKHKRKRRKSGSFGDSLKENSEKKETMEDDVRTLRTQLLSDLMRKKNLKNLEKKSVLMDSIQTSTNKPQRSTANSEAPKGLVKSPQPVKKNSLKKINAPKVSNSMNTLKMPNNEIQRIIVHLGSEDSSDEEESSPSKGSKEKEGTNNSKSPTARTERNDVECGYEKSVELLLSQARRKIENEIQAAKNRSAVPPTPEAVFKHLPPSQRLEYMRLKQKIAERERLRKEQNEKPNDKGSSNGKGLFESAATCNSKPGNLLSNTSSKSNSNPFKPLGNGDSFANSQDVDPPKSKRGVSPGTGFNNAKNESVLLQAKGLKAERQLLQNNKLLLPSSQALISKLKLLLKKIKIEKMIEENYEKEISKLKNQLNLFERKKIEQRFKIKKLGEESMKTYKAIQGITQNTVSKGERGVGKKINEGEKKSKDEKTNELNEESKNEKQELEEGKIVPPEPEPTEPIKAESEIDKEVNGFDKVNGAAMVPARLEYTSPLQMLTKVSNDSGKVDPNVVMCQFDLMGTCKDGECIYQHLRTS